MNLKKLLALILALMMVLSSLPMAFAEEVSAPVDEEVLEVEYDLGGEEEEEEDLPIVEEEDAELVNDTNIPVKVAFYQYDDGNNPKATAEPAFTANLNSGEKLGDALATAKGNLKMFATPAAYTFKGWWVEADEGEAVIGNDLNTAESVDETKAVDDDVLKTVRFVGDESNAVVANVYAQFEVAKFEVSFKADPAGALSTIPAAIADVPYGSTTKDIKTKWDAMVDAAKLAVVDGYNEEALQYKVGSTVIDENYKFTGNTEVTIVVPQTAYTVKFLKTTPENYDNVADSDVLKTVVVLNGDKLVGPTDAEVATLTAPEEGQIFDKWANTASSEGLDADTYIGKDKTVDVDENKTIYYVPSWKPKEFTVSFNLNGGTGDFPAQKVQYNKTATEPGHKPVLENKTFTGWFYNGAKFNWSTGIKQDYELVAEYDKTTITVTYHFIDYSANPPAEPNPVVTMEGIAGEKMTAYEIPAAKQKKGYQVVGWATPEGADLVNLEGAAAKKVNFEEPISTNLELYPIYEAKKLTVTFDKGGVANAEYVAVANADSNTVPASVETAYMAKFVDAKPDDADSKNVWLRPLKDVDGKEFDKWVRYDKAGNEIVVMQKVDNQWKVSEANVGTTELKANQIEDSYTLTAVWKEYYTVTLDVSEKKAAKWWYGNGPLAFDTPMDHSYKFYKDDYKTPAKIQKDVMFGKVADTDAAELITEGGKGQAVPAEPQWSVIKLVSEDESNSDKYFDGWYDGDTKVDLATYKITKSVTLKAKWLDYVTVTFDFGDGKLPDHPAPGTIEDKGTLKVPSGKTLNDFAPVKEEGKDPTYPNINKGQYGGIVPVIPVPEMNDGQTFEEWRITKEGDQTQTGKEFTLDTPITKNITLKAQYKLKQWDVTIDTNGGTFVGNFTNPIKVTNGAALPFTATTIASAVKKADATFDGLYVAEEGKKDEEIFAPGVAPWNVGETLTDGDKVTKDITLKVKWKTYIAKQATATEAPTGYYATVEELKTAINGDVKNIVLLADIKLENADKNAFQGKNGLVINLNGHTIDAANGTISGSNGEANAITLSNGTVKNAFLANVKITSGTYENVYLHPDYNSRLVEGGRFRNFVSATFAELTEADEEKYVKTLNSDEKRALKTGYGFADRDGYWTVLSLKNLYVAKDDSIDPEADGVDEDDFVKIPVFEDENTEETKEVKAAKEAWAKEENSTFLGWYTKVVNKETKKTEEKEFTFGSKLTEQTVVYAKWAENYTLVFWVRNVRIDDERKDVPVRTIVLPDSKAITEPKEQSKTEYALMTEEEAKWIKAAWQKLADEKANFLAWQYDETGANVAFGTDKPNKDVAWTYEVDQEIVKTHVIPITAEFKPLITFYGLGGKVLDEVYVEYGKTFAQSGAKLPEAPEVDGYVFEDAWYYDWDPERELTGTLFDEKRIITHDYDVVARYTGSEWKISQAGSEWDTGVTACPATDVTFGGDETTLRLYAWGDNYSISWVVEAPFGLTTDVNSPKWMYKRDDQPWKLFNDPKDDDLYTDSNQQLAMRFEEIVTQESLKELVDAKKTKTITIQLALKGQENDASKIKTLTVTLDPRNLRMYEDFDTTSEPIFRVADWKYKYTVSFDMGDALALKDIDAEYGQTWADIEGKLAFADTTKGDYDITKIEKKYFDFGGEYVFAGDEDSFGEDVQVVTDDFVIRDDLTLTPNWLPIPVTVKFWTLNEAGDEYTAENETGEVTLGGALNTLKIPEAVANESGTTAWYAVQMNGVKPNQKKIAADAWNITGTEIVGDLYYDAKDPAKSYVIKTDGDPETYTLNLIRGNESGYSVTFYYDEDMGDVLDAQYFDADADGKVSYSQIKVPDFHTDANRNQVFMGWVLVQEGQNTYDSQVFDFDLFKTETFSDNLRFVPRVKDLEAKLCLQSAIVDFSGMIHLLVKYELDRWCNWAPIRYKMAGSEVTISVEEYKELSEDEKEKYFEIPDEANAITPEQFDALKDEHKYSKYTKVPINDENRINSDRKAWGDLFVVFRLGDEELGRVALDEGEKVNPDGEAEIYKYSCPVPIVDYNDKLYIVVEDGEGNEIDTVKKSGDPVPAGGQEYSLKQYADTAAVKGSKQTMKDLGAALQDYGIAARMFFNKDYAGLTLSDKVKNLTIADMADVAALETEGTKPTGVKNSMNVAFDADNTLKVTFSNLNSASSYTFKIDGQAVTDKPENGKIELRVKNIAAKDLNVVHSFTISDGTNTYTAKLSVLTYAKLAAEKGSDNMKNLAKALYVYAKAAKAYFA